MYCAVLCCTVLRTHLDAAARQQLPWTILLYCTVLCCAVYCAVLYCARTWMPRRDHSVKKGTGALINTLALRPWRGWTCPEAWSGIPGGAWHPPPAGRPPPGARSRCPGTAARVDRTRPKDGEVTKICATEREPSAGRSSSAVVDGRAQTGEACEFAHLGFNFRARGCEFARLGSNTFAHLLLNETEHALQVRQRGHHRVQQSQRCQSDGQSHSQPRSPPQRPSHTAGGLDGTLGSPARRSLPIDGGLGSHEGWTEGWDRTGVEAGLVGDAEVGSRLHHLTQPHLALQHRAL
eukprot:1192613-Prorocentrum_minimum.AAC.2